MNFPEWWLTPKWTRSRGSSLFSGTRVCQWHWQCTSVSKSSETFSINGNQKAQRKVKRLDADLNQLSTPSQVFFDNFSLVNLPHDHIKTSPSDLAPCVSRLNDPESVDPCERSTATHRHSGPTPAASVFYTRSGTRPSQRPSLCSDTASDSWRKNRFLRNSMLLLLLIQSRSLFLRRGMSWNLLCSWRFRRGRLWRTRIFWWILLSDAENHNFAHNHLDGPARFAPSFLFCLAQPFFALLCETLYDSLEFNGNWVMQVAAIIELIAVFFPPYRFRSTTAVGVSIAQNN
jgi:hypothetical protein